jgi:deoxyribose-phosphate aldolase
MVLQLPPALRSKVNFASNQIFIPRMHKRIMNYIDLTSLSGNENQETILELATQASMHQVAALCLSPQKFEFLERYRTIKDRVKFATVINFPSGQFRTLSNEEATPETTRQDIEYALSLGVEQIDIVFPREYFLGDKLSVAKEILKSCREACGSAAIMMVILETGSFEQGVTDQESFLKTKQLQAACRLAIECGADFLKTSTGKFMIDGQIRGASLAAAAILMSEAIKGQRKYNRPIGSKISGDVSDRHQAAQYLTLAEMIYGHAVDRDIFRIGSSKLLRDIWLAMEPSLLSFEPQRKLG